MAPPRAPSNATTRTVLAGVLGWLVPGAGHLLVGQRGLALTFFLAITIPYAAGLAIGGVKNFVSVERNPWLFLAELPIGGYTVPAFLASEAVERHVARAGRDPGDPAYVAYYPASDVATIYLAAAGLLNVLAVLDAVSRAQTGGLPTFHRELVAPPGAESGR